MAEFPDDDEPLPPSETHTVDAADVKTIRRRKREISIRQSEKDAFYHNVFASKVGRRAMWEILQRAHTFETQFAAGPTGFPDPLATWFKAGEQALGQSLYLSWLQIDRAGVLLMQDENDPRFGKPAKSTKKEG